jgi:hypothetical protein
VCRDTLHFRTRKRLFTEWFTGKACGRSAKLGFVTASTKNRQVYTPVSAILKHIGIEKKIKRPTGWRGNKRTFWLKLECGINPLHYDVMNFAALVKGRFAQSLMDSFGQVQPGVDDVRPEPAGTGLRG